MENLIITDYVKNENNKTANTTNNENLQDSIPNNDTTPNNNTVENENQQKIESPPIDSNTLNIPSENKEEKIENEEPKPNEENTNSNDIKIIICENKIKSIIPQEIILDKERCNNLTQKLVKKTKENSEIKLDKFFTKKRHFLIMTDGGKPVYSRFGDAIENNSIFATISAMITKFTIFNSTNNFKEEINVISNNKNKIVFVKKGQLIFIALSKKNDCVSLLNSQLEYLYNQLMSILTIRFYEKLEDNPSKCLTAMSGTENLFEQIIEYTSHSFVSLFDSFQVMNFFENREKLNKIAEEFRGDALYCIIMSPYEIISLAHSNQINVISSDLVLIQTLIYSTQMLRSQESYVPICLPGISEQGYIQFYSHFTEENIGIIFVTENLDPMCFMKFQEQFANLYQKLINENLVDKIMEIMKKNNNVNKNYNLKKDKDENADFIDEELLINELLSQIYEKDNVLNRISTLPENNENFAKRKTITNKDMRSSTVKTKFNIIPEEIEYGVIWNKKLKQYILLNFDMDFRVLSKDDKKLLHEYNLLFDIYCKEEKEHEKEEFFYTKTKDEYVNIIYVYENYLCICSYNFFVDLNIAVKKSKELVKNIKKNENKFFILFK